jgi:hypothetical protein
MSESNQERKWAEVPGWPGYRVSDDGLVESCRTSGGVLSQTWRPLKTRISRSGYPEVRISVNRRYATVFVHTLVLTCHGPIKPPGPSMCLHYNDIKTDNRIENLRWGFGSDNMYDRIRNAKGKPYKPNRPKPEQVNAGGFSQEIVDEIRRKYAAGTVTQQQLADEYLCSLITIRHVVNHQLWNRELQKWTRRETPAEIVSEESKS